MQKVTKILTVLAIVLFGIAQTLFAQNTPSMNGTQDELQMQTFCFPGPGRNKLTQKEQLGKYLFFDRNLSEPNGQSCASCHDPDVGFTEPDKHLPVSEGVIPGRVGSRNAPTSAYQGNAPEFVFDPATSRFTGGEFLDGSALNLVEQAKVPFLNPLEMNNPNKSTVIRDVKRSKYESLFKQVYGRNIFNNVDEAYNCVADAIAAYEKSFELNKFNSKFDKFLAGKARLTAQELRGFQLFSDFDTTNGVPGRANCNACHSLIPEDGNGLPPFTNRRYRNVGVPKNMSNPFYFLPLSLNPDGRQFVDFGLGGFLKNSGQDESVYGPQMGAIHVPTLRNVALTGPYMHNGAFQSLETVVHFYNTRDVPGTGWGPPEVPQNVASAVIGNQGLSDEEEDAIVAFLKTLTDDYR
jgi:cytochrome c peroxidase